MCVFICTRCERNKDNNNNKSKTILLFSNLQSTLYTFQFYTKSHTVVENWQTDIPHLLSILLWL